MSTVGIQVRGAPELIHALQQFEDAPAKKVLQKAATAGAKALKPFVVAAAPRGETGRLRRSISARRAKKQLPAAVVSARPKVAFYRHMVIGGTKDHGPRKAKVMVFQGNFHGVEGAIVARRVKGTKARPFIEEGFRAGEPAALRAIDKVLDQALAGALT